MAPYFLRNLVPRREKRESQRPLLQVLSELTAIQWAMFFSGCVCSSSRSSQSLTLAYQLVSMDMRRYWFVTPLARLPSDSPCSLDFFSVSLSVKPLSELFERDTEDIVRTFPLPSAQKFPDRHRFSRRKR